MQVQMTQADRPLTGSSVDISPYGMRVRLHLRKVLAPKEDVSLQVIDHGRPYLMDGIVCWYKRDVVDNSRYVGLRFKNLNYQFCRDILNLQAGGLELPYRCYYDSKESFMKEYLQNIIFGGLLMKTKGSLPPLFSRVHVELAIPEKEDPFKVEGEVVAHVPGGFGLNLIDLDHYKVSLNAWMNT